MPALPAILRQQARTGAEIGERRGIGGRGLGAFAGQQVQFGHALPFLPRLDHANAAIELVDDLEDPVRDRLGRQIGSQDAANAQVGRGAQVRRDQRIGRFLNAVMEEGIGVFLLVHQARPLGFPQQGVDCLRRQSEDEAERGGIGGISQAGELGQGVLRLLGQAGELAHHQVHHIVGIALGMNAGYIPLPGPVAGVEAQQFLLGQSGQELASEEGVAAGLVQYQLCQRLRLGRRAMQRLDNKLRDFVEGQGSEHDTLHGTARLADRLQAEQQRVGGIHFVVTISPEQQEMAHVRVCHQVFEQRQRGRIHPLQVVEEQHQRMFWPGEHAEETPEHQLEAALRFLGRQVGHGQLRADDNLELGDEIDHELAVELQRFAQGLPPVRDVGVALAQDLAHQAVESLG